MKFPSVRLIHVIIWVGSILLGSISINTNQLLEFVFVRHAISLHGHNVREEYTIHVKNTAELDSGQNVNFVDILLRQGVISDLSYIVAYSELPNPQDEDNPSFSVLKQLEVDDAALDELKNLTNEPVVLVRFALPGYLPPQFVHAMRVMLVFTNAAKALPPLVPQGSRHSWIYSLDSVLLSRYKIHEQETLVMLPKTQLIETSTNVPELAILDDHIKLGPFKDLTPFSSRGPFTVLFYNDIPRIVVESHTRRLVISYWLQEVQVEESYDLYNDSPKLLGPFSRALHSVIMADKSMVPPMTGMRLYVPSVASDVTYSDEVGNISTFVFTVVKNPRSSMPPELGAVDISPRFPLCPGFRSSFKLTYKLPLALYEVATDKSLHTLKFPMVNFFNDVVIKKFQFQLVLPEGSYKLNPEFPFTGASLNLFFEGGPLDVLGRPSLHFSAHNIVREHHSDFTISYEYSMLQKSWRPLLIVIFFFVLFLAYYCYKRLLNVSSIFVSKMEQVAVKCA